ncbi:MAG TPA: hypothetical protein VGO11_05555, partial [Chthoniobacteraceae bacterium]|nr:hypothetical protein [Chthoniobacteraceae bacterium]
MISSRSLRLTCTILFLTAMVWSPLASTLQAQTALNAGDIVILGFNTSNPDTVSVGLLTNIAAGTTFTLTDNGWAAGGGFGATSEGTLTFTAPG